VTAPALNGLSPEQALAAWKGINSKAHEPLFPLTVVGTGLLALGCAVAGWRTRGRVWHISSALLYWIGVIGTTLTVEAGINNAVVAATHPPLDLQRMLATWLAGNHVRATSALAAFVAAWIGCYNSNRQTSRGEP